MIAAYDLAQPSPLSEAPLAARQRVSLIPMSSRYASSAPSPSCTLFLHFLTREAAAARLYVALFDQIGGSGGRTTSALACGCAPVDPVRGHYIIVVAHLRGFALFLSLSRAPLTPVPTRGLGRGSPLRRASVEAAFSL